MKKPEGLTRQEKAKVKSRNKNVIAKWEAKLETLEQRDPRTRPLHALKFFPTHGATAANIAGITGQPEAVVKSTLDHLASKGFLYRRVRPDPEAVTTQRRKTRIVYQCLETN